MPIPDLTAEPLEPGELMAANIGLRCCPCADKAITDGTGTEDVPAAFTMEIRKSVV